MKNKYSIVFFGTPSFAVSVLEELTKTGIVPSLIVTAPDRPQGRGLLLTPPPVKLWAEKNFVSTLEPEKLDDAFIETLSSEGPFDLFIVAAYGKIIPKAVLAIPRKGTLNVHPSLLPKYRGASPVEGAILSGEKETGVSIMLLDEEMDHGPVLMQETVSLAPLPFARDLEETLAHRGGALLARIIPLWLEGTMKAEEQDHGKATFTKKIKKEDGLLLNTDSDETKWRKFRAYTPWPGIYFFMGEKRIVVKDAMFENGIFTITRVTPEGGKEMPYKDFLKGEVILK